jgi:butyrate kinase
LTYDEAFTAMIRKRVEWIAEVFISSGEREMEALARGALRVLKGEEEAKVY